ncbi:MULTISPECIES: hypothetical protein [Methanocalculus]|uniref:hypothetical protein n=1 Tax=Methanocalculus TaxID=71151 RepID=UPI0020A012E4|nr:MULTISPECIES: hypothetical protein [unclassified Methanocalculus]MCP1661781.1 hypothetical protein [Methanocalculus sp. AMF5]
MREKEKMRGEEIEEMEGTEKEIENCQGGQNIKSDMIDQDSILTEEDYICLQKYRLEKEKGLLISESEAREGLGLEHIQSLYFIDNET